MSQNLARMTDDRQRILRAMDSLTPVRLADLDRRSRFKATRDAQSESVGRSVGHVSDPTGNHVANLLDGKNCSDPIWESVRRVAQILADMADLSLALANEARFVESAADQAGIAKTIHCCAACGREVAGGPRDRIRSGYCGADFQAWTRAGKPYRAQFEAQRREWWAAKAEKSKVPT